MYESTGISIAARSKTRTIRGSTIRAKPSGDAAQAAVCRRKPAGRSGAGRRLRHGQDSAGAGAGPAIERVLPAIRTIGFPADVAHRVDVVPGRRVAAPPAAGRGLDQTIRRIKQFLGENEGRDKHAVVVVDEAHLLEDVQSLEALRLLSELSATTAQALTLLLVGQPRILPIVDRMPGLEERLAIKCLLRPLTLEETVSYVVSLEHRGRKAADLRARRWKRYTP